MWLSDGNDGSCFDGTRLGLVGDQFAQERNQHDEHDTDREAAGAKLREELYVPGVGGDRCGAGRLGDYSRKVACKQRREAGIFTRFVALGDRGPSTPAVLFKFSRQISSIISRL